MARLPGALLSWALPTSSLDNGVALTPPMGWLRRATHRPPPLTLRSCPQWEADACDLDCAQDDGCINDKLYMRGRPDGERGYKGAALLPPTPPHPEPHCWLPADVGYEYVNVSACSRGLRLLSAPGAVRS